MFEYKENYSQKWILIQINGFVNGDRLFKFHIKSPWNNQNDTGTISYVTVFTVK